MLTPVLELAANGLLGCLIFFRPGRPDDEVEVVVPWTIALVTTCIGALFVLTVL